MKKDLLLVCAIAAVAVAAFVATGGDAPPPAPAGDPFKPAAAGVEAQPVELRYTSEGGLSPIERFEVSLRGPGDASVRYQIRNRPAVERTHRVSEGEFRAVMDQLSRAQFFEVESVPRSGYFADMATVAIALRIGDQQNDVTIDARRRASRDLSAVLEFFDGIRKAVTPAPVESGD